MDVAVNLQLLNLLISGTIWFALRQLLRFVFERSSVAISTGAPAILTEGFLDFPQFLLECAGKVVRLGQDGFFPNPFQFIILHISSCNSTLYILSTDIVVEKVTKIMLAFHYRNSCLEMC